MDHDLDTLPPGNYLLTVLPEGGYRVWNITFIDSPENLRQHFDKLNQRANIDKAIALSESEE